MNGAYFKGWGYCVFWEPKLNADGSINQNGKRIRRTDDGDGMQAEDACHGRIRYPMTLNNGNPANPFTSW